MLSAAFLALALVPLSVRAASPVVQDNSVSVGGYRLRYLEAGSGPPIVLLHGLGADSRTWRLAMPVLADQGHVYALDQLGFGQSEKPEISYRVQTLVDSLGGFLDAMHLDRASIVGNSLGGWVAASFAASHPERVDHLVLVDAAGYGEPGQIVEDYLSHFDPGMAAQAQQFLSGLSPEERKAMEAALAAYFARRSRGDGYAMGSLIQSIVRGEDALGDSVKRIKAPTLVLWGRNDPVIPVQTADKLADDIPKAKKIVLDGCGHRPQVECSSVFAKAVQKFLAPVAGARTD
jgi:pimeloyl-ACP methyl ester carboxylesterase